MFDKQERYALGATDFAVARAFIWNSLSFGPSVSLASCFAKHLQAV